mgnify:CR=1 FL=1
MTTDAEQYYVRIRGKVAGPFTVAQLQKLKARGQFRRVHQVSPDGTNWQPAAELLSLFPAKPEKPKVSVKTASDAAGEESDYPVGENVPAAATEDQWYYSIDEAQFGPVSFHEMQRLAKFQKIGPDDMVWTTGMEYWLPAKSDTRLFSDESKEEEAIDGASQSDTADVEINTRRQHNIRAAQPSQTPQVSHILEFVVEGMHEWFTDEQLRSTNTFFIRAGKLMMYIAILIISVYHIVIATRQDSLAKALGGVGLVVALFAMQYAGVRLFQAMSSLVDSTPTRISTTAFADSIAIISSALAFVVLIIGIYQAIQIESIQLALVVICFFCAFQYVAVVALNPSFLNVTTDTAASTGKEAIGVYSFLAMLGVRALPIAYTFSVAAMIAVWSMAVYVLLNSKSEATVVLPGVSDFVQETIWVAAMPLIGYILFISYYLAIDVLGAVLALPSRVDALRPEKDSQ